MNTYPLDRTTPETLRASMAVAEAAIAQARADGTLLRVNTGDTAITIYEIGDELPQPDPLAGAKAAAKATIEVERDADCARSVTAHGRLWQADEHSQALLNSAITLAQAGLPLPPVWRDADNDDMPISNLSDLLAIAGAIAQQVQIAYATSWARKAAVDSAKSVEAVLAA